MRPGKIIVRATAFLRLHEFRSTKMLRKFRVFHSARGPRFSGAFLDDQNAVMALRTRRWCVSF